MADASMNNQPSPHLLQGQLLLKRVSDLELKVSAVAEEEAKVIKHLKDKASDESYKNDLARLEDHLNANRESTTNEMSSRLRYSSISWEQLNYLMENWRNGSMNHAAITPTLLE